MRIDNHSRQRWKKVADWLLSLYSFKLQLLASGHHTALVATSDRVPDCQQARMSVLFMERNRILCSAVVG